MKISGGAIACLFAAWVAGLYLLTQHDQAIIALMQQNGLHYGCDWVWAEIPECTPFWVAQPKLSTGEVLRVPFMGFGGVRG